MKNSGLNVTPELYAPVDAAEVDTVVSQPNTVYARTPKNSAGIALNVSGWSMGAKPIVYDEKGESGRIVFDISVNEVGLLVSVFTKESNLSPQLTEAYRKAVGKMKLVPKADNVSAVSRGTISFNIKSR